MSPTSKPRRARCSTPPSASIIPPIPRNGPIHTSERGSTLCSRCCSGAWKRRGSANPQSSLRALSPRHHTEAARVPLGDPDPCRPRDCAPPLACCLISFKSGTRLAGIVSAEGSVLLAVFTDIHANRQAFSACLDIARARGAERMIFLGDYVGYGADPEWAVEVVMCLGDAGAVAG